ncbi:hypothetical protein [Guptibacillus algicola]|uniref:hypothetical protein n=1 Tax=Guptibacillus algicola TaxID=225844 RepID=UPI001CD21F7D|nr:hypothetical protein [Alkalihalobacillus algicola]MCA0987527.1 hypothetical protein [Alkalihalobacillus algicola]
MRKALSAFGLFLLIVMLVGCSDEVQDDLVSYWQDSMTPLLQEEKLIIGTYDSVVGANSTDDHTTYATLIDDVIPKYTDYIEDVEAVTIETAELQEVHEIYVTSLKTQHAGFLTLVEAFEQEDAALVEEANAKLDEAKELMEAYNTGIQKLASEHDVTFE